MCWINANCITWTVDEKEKALVDITPGSRGVYGRIYAVGTCNFGVRRVNTDVSLDNNIPVGFKAWSLGVNDHGILNFSMVFRDDDHE